MPFGNQQVVRQTTQTTRTSQIPPTSVSYPRQTVLPPRFTPAPTPDGPVVSFGPTPGGPMMGVVPTPTPGAPAVSFGPLSAPPAPMPGAPMMGAPPRIDPFALYCGQSQSAAPLSAPPAPTPGAPVAGAAPTPGAPADPASYINMLKERCAKKRGTEAAFLPETYEAAMRARPGQPPGSIGPEARRVSRSSAHCQPSTVLRASLLRDFAIPRPNANFQAHHIVATHNTDGRRIINRHGIADNSFANGVLLPVSKGDTTGYATPHSGGHEAIYDNCVNLLLQRRSETLRGASNEEKAAAERTTLNDVRIMLLAGEFPLNSGGGHVSRVRERTVAAFKKLDPGGEYDRLPSS